MKKAYSLRFSRSAKTYEKWAIPQRESARKLVDFVKPRGRVLDLGCGTGFVSRFLPEGCEAFGVDISHGMVEAYIKDFRYAVVGDAESLPFRDRSFDYVLSNFSLHWTDLSKSFREALRVSKIGFGLAVPVEGSLRGLDFPFPSVEKILSILDGKCVEFFTETLEIPFSSWDLVRFFHYTGSSLNPRRKGLLSRTEIEKLINSIDSPSFRMLFLYAWV